MGLCAMLCWKTDEHHLTLPHPGRNDGRATCEVLLTEQPAALQQFAVGVAGYHVIAFGALRRDLEGRAVEEKRQTVRRHTVRDRIGVVEAHLEHRPRAPEFLAGLA